MDVLLVEKDPLVRDQVKVALQQFSDFTVTVGAGLAGINEARSRHFDCVFVGVDDRQKDAKKLLHSLRSFDSTSELFVLTTARTARDMAADKGKLNINSFVQTPIVVRELFGLLGRFLERRTERQNSTLRKQARNAAPSRG